MPFVSVPDAYDLWLAHQQRLDRELERLPVCFHCKQPVQQDMAVCLDVGWLCDDCIKNNMKEVTDYD